MLPFVQTEKGEHGRFHNVGFPGLFFSALFSCSFFMMFFANSPLEAGELSAELELMAAAANNNELVSVVIDIPEKLNVVELRNNKKIIPRADLVVALKSHAEKTQAPTLQLLKNIKAEHIRSLWMVNQVSARVAAAELKKLAALPSVGKIKKNRVMKRTINNTSMQ